MHSKYQVWDFLSNYPQTIVPNKEGIYVFTAADPYIENILTNHLPKKEKNFHCYSGSDITRDFIEEHFCNLSFFSETQNIYVLNAESIPSQSFTMFVEKINEMSAQFVVLFFSKTNKFLLELQKNSAVQSVLIEAPKNWDGPKILQALVKEKKLQLKSDVTKFLLENIEHTFENMVRALDIIQVTFPEGNIDFNELKLLLSRERFDFFELINLYAQNPKRLYGLLLNYELDMDELRTIASSLQGHLAKVLFPANLLLKEKDKLNTYEKTVLNQNEKLSLIQVKSDLKFFADLEILAKARDQLILNHLRCKIIE